MFELFNFTNEELFNSLEIMGVGMLGLFVVMIIVALVVVLLNQIDKNSNNNSNS